MFFPKIDVFNFMMTLDVRIREVVEPGFFTIYLKEFPTNSSLFSSALTT